MSIYDKTKMMCRTWIESVNNLFNMGKDLETEVDGLKGGIVKDVTLTEVDKHYTLTILYDDGTSDTVTWDDSTVGIEDITMTYQDGVYILTITLTDGTRYTFSIPVGNVVTEQELQNALALKADVSTTYTKTEVDTALATKANVNDVYTKTEVYNKSEIDISLSTKANTSDVYNKTEVNGLISNIKQPIIESLASLGTTSVDGLRYAFQNMNAGSSIEITTISDGTNSAYAVEINARQILSPPLSGRHYFQCNGTIQVSGSFYNLYQCDMNFATDIITFYYINGANAQNVAMTPNSVADGFWLHY